MKNITRCRTRFATRDLLAVFTFTAALESAILIGATSTLSDRDHAATPTSDEAIVHTLNRIAFGPAPSDVDRVRKMGLTAYIDEQLHPERIPNSAVDARLASLETLNLSSEQLAQEYFVPLLMERRDRKQEHARAADKPQNEQPEMQARPDGQPAARGPDGRDRSPGMIEAQRKARLVVTELSEAKILRAAYSERQLEEVLTDFWFNHFNVFAGKNGDQHYLTEYERDVIRPHVLGKFRELLGATAESPAMLFYLDNWMSSDPSAPSRLETERQRIRQGTGGAVGRRRAGGLGRPNQAGLPNGRTPEMTEQRQPQLQQRMARGLNENYARELLELHTLGVDGGYTQEDIVAVARAFTGWTIDRPRMGGDFQFNSRRHDDGEKVVLGKTIKSGGGRKDGEQVLDILAKHPSTAKFISTKLARRFVADEPPAPLVERAAKRFTETDGDLREVVRTIITSPEFFAETSARAKVKTPFEFVVSAVRVTSTNVADAESLTRSLRELGQPLYFAQPPTGYADKADVWVNTGALVGRMNFALTLVSNRAPGIAVDLTQLAGPSDGEPVWDRVVAAILPSGVSDATRATLDKAVGIEKVAALALGSPEFQQR